MKFTMTVDMDNTAFDEAHAATELGEILARLNLALHEIGDNHLGTGAAGRLVDSNGNTVGYWEIT